MRNGSVIDLQIGAGKVTALVQGSELYKVAIEIDPLSAGRWKEFKAAAAGKVTNLLDLLQGKLSKEILADITAKGNGLFPSPKEIGLDCSCPDWADMCKHVAAVLFGIGARLDSKPELFFTLRGVNMEELIDAASQSAAAPLKGKTRTKKSALADADLSELFGVEVEVGKKIKDTKASTRAKTKTASAKIKSTARKSSTRPVTNTIVKRKSKS